MKLLMLIYLAAAFLTLIFNTYKKDPDFFEFLVELINYF